MNSGQKKYKYKAFISYSHAADGKLAPAIQSALHKFAKPWYRLRMMNIFRDRTNLSISPGLWPTIEKALGDSEYFFLFASPGAAQSKWVKKEVEWWLKNRPTSQLFIILTDGKIKWNEEDNDFDWNYSTALPVVLKSKFSFEPNYIDFSWAKKSEDLTLRNPLFLESILTIASPLHGKDKEDLGGEDIRQHKLTRVLTWSVCLLITLAGIIAVWQAVAANRQRKEAIKQGEISLSRQLAAQSELLRSQDFRSLPLAVLLSAEAINIYSSSEINQVAWRGIVLLPELQNEIKHRDVSQIKFSPDGKYIATAGQDSSARITRMDNNEVVSIIRHKGSVWDVAFSPDNNLIATAGDDDTIRVVDFKNNKTVLVLNHNGPVRKVCFNYDGTLLASASADSSARIWRVSDGKVIGNIKHRAIVWSLAFSHNGKYFATASRDSTAIVWEIESQKKMYQLKHDDILWGIYFGNDDKHLMSVSEDKSARIWDMKDGKEIKRLEHSGRITAGAFSPDGKTLATVGWDKTIKFWSTDGFRQLATINTDGLMISVAYSPDGKFIACGGSTTSVWSTETYKEVNRLYMELETYNVCFSPDNNYVATGDSKLGRVWKIKSKNQQVLETMDRVPDRGGSFITRGWQVATNDQANYLLTGNPGGLATLWNTDKSQVFLQFAQGGATSAVAYSSDGSKVATAGDSSIRVFDANKGNLLCIYPYKKGTEYIAFDPQSKYLAIGGKDSIFVLALEKQKIVFKSASAEAIYFTAFNSTSKILITIDAENTLKTWDWGNNKIIEGHRYRGLSAAVLANDRNSISLLTDSLLSIVPIDENRKNQEGIYINDGWYLAQTVDMQLVAVCPLKGKNVRIINTKTSKVIKEIAHSSNVYSVCFDKKNQYLATGCNDGSIHIWDLGTGQEIALIHWRPENSVIDLRFSSDGRFIIAASINYQTGVWLWQPQDIISKTCSLINRPLNQEEWNLYMRNKKYAPLCNK